MAGSGFIKLDRKLLDWRWWGDRNTRDLWIYILLRANWEDREWQNTTIPRGSLLTSQQHLADEVGLTRQTIRTSLRKLESTGEITIKTTNRQTIITVEKYDDYQFGGSDTNQVTNHELTSNQPATNQQLTTNKELKELKNKRINIASSKLVEISDTFNAVCTTLPKVTRLTDKRKNKIRERLRTFSEKDFLDCFRLVDESDFLSGRNGKWQNCTFDWIVDSDTHMQRILEGSYQNRETVQTDSFQDAWRRLDEKERSL